VQGKNVLFTSRERARREFKGGGGYREDQKRIGGPRKVPYEFYLSRAFFRRIGTLNRLHFKRADSLTEKEGNQGLGGGGFFSPGILVRHYFRTLEAGAGIGEAGCSEVSNEIYNVGGGGGLYCLRAERG